MAILLEAAFDRVFATQQIYRLLLDAMARPGKLERIPDLCLNPPAGLSAIAAAVAFTLLDSATSFAVLPQHSEWENYFQVNTGAVAAPPAQAGFLIIDGSRPPALGNVNRGTLTAPEYGATLIVMVDKLGKQGDGGLLLSLTGPGIREVSQLTVAGLCPEAIIQITELNREFPLGVDLILGDGDGRLACIPRSATIKRQVIA